jgi:hypothetical protein
MATPSVSCSVVFVVVLVDAIGTQLPKALPLRSPAPEKQETPRPRRAQEVRANAYVRRSP